MNPEMNMLFLEKYLFRLLLFLISPFIINNETVVYKYIISFRVFFDLQGIHRRRQEEYYFH